MQEIYSEPVKEELILQRINLVKEKGGIAAFSGTPQAAIKFQKTLNNLRSKLMNATRNNPNFKIPIGNKGSIDSEAMRIKKYDAATGGEFSKMLGR